MVKKLTFVFVICVLFLTGCGEQGPKEFSISGQVVDYNGVPLEGVTITLSGEESMIATSDQQGRWEFSGIKSEVTVNAAKEEWLLGPIDAVVKEECADFYFVGAKDQVVDFPDHNLRSAVQELVGAEEIRVSDLLIYSDVNLRSKHIQDISGIEFFLSLRRLSVGSNDISDLSSISKLKNLQSLLLRQNQISNVEPLQYNKKLERLWLEKNQISDITPLSSLDSLYEVYLSRNKIEDLGALANKPWLSKIYVDMNGYFLDDISNLYNIPHLSNFCISETSLTDINALTRFPNLLYVALIKSPIKDISALARLEKLYRLELIDTEIDDIDILLKVKNLKSLKIEENHNLDLTEGSKAWNVLRKLEEKGVFVNHIWPDLSTDSQNN